MLAETRDDRSALTLAVAASCERSSPISRSSSVTLPSSSSRASPTISRTPPSASSRNDPLALLEILVEGGLHPLQALRRGARLLRLLAERGLERLRLQLETSLGGPHAGLDGAREPRLDLVRARAHLAPGLRPQPRIGVRAGRRSRGPGLRPGPRDQVLDDPVEILPGATHPLLGGAPLPRCPGLVAHAGLIYQGFSGPCRTERRSVPGPESGYDRPMATRPDPRLLRLRVALEGMRRDRDAVDAASAALTEAMASTARRLAEDARDADFSPPDWPGGIDRTVEIRLSETREVTLRLAGGGSR